MEQEFAQRYGDLAEWHWWFRGRAKIVESVLRRHLPGRSSRDILSVGAGPAQGLAWLLPFAGSAGTVTGLDPEPAHAMPCPQKVQFVIGRMEDSAFPDASFDVVLALDVLEHLDDDLAGLRQAIRMLRPGGFLVITVPAFPFLWGGQDVVNHHRRRYTKRTLTGLLERGGLQNFEVTYFNTLLFPAAATIRTARRLCGHANRSRSDNEGSQPGVLNSALSYIFGLERHLIGRVPMPAGVSLMATYHKLATM